MPGGNEEASVEAKIYIRPSTTLTERKLKLRSSQIMILFKYINKVLLNLINVENYR